MSTSVRGVGAVHPDHPGKQGVIPRTGAAAHDSRGNRGVEGLNKPPEFGDRPLGADDTPAHQDQGPLGGLNHLKQLLNVLVIGLWIAQIVAGPAEHGRQTAMPAVLAHRQGFIVTGVISDIF